MGSQELFPGVLGSLLRAVYPSRASNRKHITPFPPPGAQSTILSLPPSTPNTKAPGSQALPSAEIQGPTGRGLCLGPSAQGGSVGMQTFAGRSVSE